MYPPEIYITIIYFMTAIILSIVDLAMSNNEVNYDAAIIICSSIFIIVLLYNYLPLMYFLSFYFMALFMMSWIMIALRKIGGTDTTIKQSRDYIDISFSVLFVLSMIYFTFY